MPIKVTCACGASFAAKDELAGKTVKCPKCQKPLAIPGAAMAAAQPRTAASAAPSATEAPSIFDEAGIKAKPHTGHVCPSCFHSLKQGAILCVHCGYNLQLGRKLQTQSFVQDEGGHGVNAAVALQRAADTIEDEKKEERKKTSEGLPWWAYLLLFAGAVGLLAVLLMLPAKVAGMVAGVALISLSGLISLYAYIRVVVIAFTHNVGEGFGTLLCGCYWFVYCFLHWDECGGYFIMYLISIPISALGGGVFQFAQMESKEANLHLPERAPAAVVRSIDPGELPRRITRV